MPKPINVKDLIKKTKLLGSDVTQFFDAEQDWRDFLATRLDPALLGHVTAIAVKPPRLTIYVESPAWSVRLKYALAEIDPQIRQRDAAITAVQVRVRPGAAAANR